MTKKVLQQEGIPASVHETLAQVLYNQKRFEEAYNSIQIALQADPYGDVYNLAGDILNKLDKKAEAVQMWELALEDGCTDSSIKSKISASKAP